MTRKIFCVAMILGILLNGCISRGLNERYASFTEQRLVAQSLDVLIKALPEEDFESLAGQTVYLQAYFIEQPDPSVVAPAERTARIDFARQRLRFELQEKYGCRLVETTQDATYQVHFFFNAIGTDQDILGLSTPQLFLPGMGISRIDFLALEMFHGLSEGYYYIVDRQQAKTLRGQLQKARVRTDRLNLPFISIPLKTLN